MQQREARSRFEHTILPHLAAAYNLARWLTSNDQDAEDVVQEACVRAFRSFDGYRGGDNARPWLLRIVRNTTYTWLRRNRALEPALSFDESLHALPCEELNPEAIVLRHVDAGLLRQALEELPVEYREAIVLRELEGLSYKEIGEIAAVPLGTVMSRLARARKRLADSLGERLAEGSERGL
ncbi:MAG: sigma-70 family RNA polymerase sigma factor [Capsulimonas sp.]|uniref:sigma-70 family RNA polymerase sigma factor n=1 Tax=Capsulimonas sp. TaxID=2494211 RepID=UPI0032670948